ncbi:MBL fold metallo-hydrolase RNA specificity domain-containing protein [Patescibacteria group bacterium]
MTLSFHGAARGVTGSCHLLKTKDADGKTCQLLFDCGMFQGQRSNIERNFEDFGFEASQIDAVFVTHAHADHTGRLPKLIKEGYKGTIYMTLPTVGLSKLVLEDAYHIMAENHEEYGDPMLYDLEDLESMTSKTKGVGYHEQVTIAPGITIMFHDVGHILGSAYISVEAEGKRVIFSGDVGNDQVPILPETESISQADVVVCESTYGNRVHEAVVERSQKLRECIEQTIKNKSVLMIPAFSIERTQELLYEIDQLLLNELNTNIPIYLDSPMAIKATELYRHFKNYLKFDAPILAEPDRDFFSFPNLQETLRVAESKVINDTPGPKIIIAGSGMMSGGRIMHHLMRYLPDPKNMLLIIGYQAEGTLGRQIYEGAKEVKIYRNKISVKAQVTAIGSFSAHGDKNKLTRWLQSEEGKLPEKIFLVHGEPEAKEMFATHLKHHLKTKVIIPDFQSSHEL